MSEPSPVAPSSPKIHPAAFGILLSTLAHGETEARHTEMTYLGFPRKARAGLGLEAGPRSPSVHPTAQPGCQERGPILLLGAAGVTGDSQPHLCMGRT